MHRTRTRLALGLLTASEFWSSLGLQIILFIAPLVAVQSLGANPLEVGLLNLTEAAAALIFGLGIGQIIDRRGGALSITYANVIRVIACVLLAIALFVGPSLAILYATMFLIGIASLLSDAGTTTAIVEFVGRSGKDLNRANSLLRTSAIVSSLGGPGLGGLIIAIATFTIASLLGAFSFAIAAGCSFVILKSRRMVIRSAGLSSDVDNEVAKVSDQAERENSNLAGLRYIWRNRFLRRVVGSSLHFNFFSAAFQAVFVIYCLRILGFEVWTMAIVGVVTGVGGIFGAIFSSSAIAATYPRRLYTLSLSIPALCVLVMLLAQYATATWIAVVLVASVNAIFAFCMVVCVVLFNTARQITTPDSLMGKVAASERMIAIGGEVPGALTGGVVGTFLSVEHSMWFAIVGMLFAALWLLNIHTWPSGDEQPAVVR